MPGLVISLLLSLLPVAIRASVFLALRRALVAGVLRSSLLLWALAALSAAFGPGLLLLLTGGLLGLSLGALALLLALWTLAPLLALGPLLLAATLFLSAALGTFLRRLHLLGQTSLALLALLASLSLALVAALLLALLISFLQATQANVAHYVYKLRLYVLGFSRSNFHGFQFIGNDVLVVHGADLAHPLYGEGVLLIAVGQHVPHQVFKDVFFNKGSRTAGYTQQVGIFRKALQGIQVRIQLVV